METTNLYIIQEVLSDYTFGMAVIAADSLERCRELFKNEFCKDDDWLSDRLMPEYDAAIKSDYYKVLSVVGQDEGVVSYVHGGG